MSDALSEALIARRADETYRPDIDGLRALAIGAVLLFHFDLLRAEGGFAGVDVFFVISGYLMTSMLARSAGAPGGLMRFYQRRFWRVAPAYFVTLAAALVAGMSIMLPVDVEQLGASALASAFFVSNFFFSRGVGYFDTASIYKPLLHTWSLAVEMQFYLVWPFVTMAVLKARPSRRAPALLLVLALSFTVCQVLSITDAKSAFFSLPARIWEFALGGLAALSGLAALGGGALATRLKPAAPALQWMALAAIALTPWLTGEGDSWPAPWALPACLGTAFLLMPGGEGAVARLLASPPFVFIGRISYSLYLVHWPIIVFTSYRFFPQLPLWARLLSLAACVPLAMLLHRFVETPMRGLGRAGVGGFGARAVAAGVALFCLGLGTLAHLAPRRLSVVQASTDAEPPLNVFVCAPSRQSASRQSFCRIGAGDGEPTSLIWGDSHGMHFAQGYAALLSGTGGAMHVALRDACPPVAGVNRVANGLSRRDDCGRGNAEVFAAILASPDIQTVILAARWAYYAETNRFGAEKGGRAFIVTDAARERSVENSRRQLETALAEEVGALARAGKRVVLLGQVPEMGFNASRCVLMTSLARSDPGVCDIPRARVDERQKFAAAMLARVAAAHDNARYLDPRAVLCDASVCGARLDGVPAYRDDNHLTAAAASRVIERLFAEPR